MYGSTVLVQYCVVYGTVQYITIVGGPCWEFRTGKGTDKSRTRRDGNEIFVTDRIESNQGQTVIFFKGVFFSKIYHAKGVKWGKSSYAQSV